MFNLLKLYKMSRANNWNQLEFWKYIEALQLEREKEDLTFFEYYLALLFIIYPEIDWYEKSSNEIFEEFFQNNWLQNEIKCQIKQSVGEFKLIKFDKITLAEWIDIDAFLTKKKFENVVPILYRKTKEDEWGNIIYEPYKFSTSERIEIFEEFLVDDLYGAIEAISKWREDVISSFPVIFSPAEDDELSDEEKDGLTQEEVKEIERDIKKENERRRYGWQKTLDSISGGQWNHIPQILELPVLFVFNMMTMQEKYK